MAKIKRKADFWRYWLPWWCSSSTWGASPDRAHPGLHWKPLDAAIGRVSVPYCPGGLHCQRICWKHTNTNKTQLLASNYGTFWSLVVCENFIPQNRPPLLSSSMQQASFKCEMPLLELKSSRTFLAIKRCRGQKVKKVIKRPRSLLKKLVHMCATRG
jgi:hypothetical protein